MSVVHEDEPRFIRYPHIDRIELLKPNSSILLGKQLTFTEKVDGSNLRFMMKANGYDYKGLKIEYDDPNTLVGLGYDLVISSRNQDVASNEFQTKAKATDEYPKIVEFMNENPYFAIFAELRSGMGPTRIEPVMEKPSLTVFDVWSSGERNFLSYVPMFQMCYHYGLPVVERWCTGTFTNLESLYEYVEKVLLEAKEKQREGTVIKYVDPSPKAEFRFIYAKEKLDIPKRAKLQHNIDKGARVDLPQLPESEVRGEWSKMQADYGTEKLRDKSFAMPEFARRVSQAAKDANCGPPSGTLFNLYLNYLKESG